MGRGPNGSATVPLRPPRARGRPLRASPRRPLRLIRSWSYSSARSGQPEQPLCRPVADPLDIPGSEAGGGEGRCRALSGPERLIASERDAISPVDLDGEPQRVRRLADAVQVQLA